MPKVVGVRFNPVTKIYFFDPTNFSKLTADDRVIVETARGMELGMVASPVRSVPRSEIKGKLKRVIREATPVDLLQAEQYKAQEPSAVEKCNELIAKMKVPIKILQANYNFDGSRLLFSFTSEQRVDFRDLVKELARSLRTRIEMKQVGARDETKLIDGYGRCGRRLCCSSWLTEFHPVSIRMAKQQGLPLAPSEISGLCGRLLCCLAYEDEFYVEMKKLMPRVGAQVQTSEGITGTVRGLNVVKETLLLETEEHDSYIEVELNDIGQPDDKRKKEVTSPPQERTSVEAEPKKTGQQEDQQRKPPRPRKPRKRSNVDTESKDTGQPEDEKRKPSRPRRSQRRHRPKKQ